jgi:CBS domain-containing protein
MTSNPVCVNADDLLAKARTIIRKHGYRALPVLDKGRLVGIISRSDILKVTSTKTNLQVRGLMSHNVVTVSDGEELTNAARLMVKNAVRQTPVLDRSGRLVGILSALDILNAFVEKRINPVKKSVREVMSVDVVSCSPEENITKVWEKMLSTGFSGLPVVEKNKVVGIITRMDLLKHGSARPHRESGKNKHVPVRKVMEKKVITANIGDDTAIVARLMTANRIIRIPVVEKGTKLAGIVDVEDILKAFV